MSKTSKTTPTSGIKLVFFGNERIATSVFTSCPTLQKLIDAGHEIAAVVTQQHETGASRKQRKLEIADLAARHEIPLLTPERPSDILDELQAMRADIGVLVAYGKIIPQEIIDIFPGGIVNIHPSLLPRHRGSTPIESTILAGEQKTGVSLMQLEKRMDAGNVYAYSEVELLGNESKQALASELLELGSEMLVTLIPRIVSGEIVSRPQDEADATYDALLTKKDSEIDLSKSAIRLEREIRAYLGWPGSRTIIAGKEVAIIAAHVSKNRLENVDKKSIFVANKQLCLQTADGILVIDELKPAGKNTMPTHAFLAGYGTNI
ncbi:methionyl-tRNA formyltransferase [Candidatus Saccharibacteria bacterium]|nr:MAG: methionyl-tRNA formyltransferase [Candidatus Saccharibacteria bacterium]PID98838.1 MAG: methionyl-tRNA formyltransferase [Candidatus Saccharibacteria bacterium]